MPKSPVILYLRLDASNDPVFDPGSALSDLDAVTQAIKTRLLLFQGEWWENLNEGTPMFQSILGAPASASHQKAMNSILTQRTAGTPYVQTVAGVASAINRANRAFSFSAIADTAFGQTSEITAAPAALATIGS